MPSGRNLCGSDPPGTPLRPIWQLSKWIGWSSSLLFTFTFWHNSTRTLNHSHNNARQIEGFEGQGPQIRLQGSSLPIHISAIHRTNTISHGAQSRRESRRRNEQNCASEIMRKDKKETNSRDKSGSLPKAHQRNTPRSSSSVCIHYPWCYFRVLDFRAHSWFVFRSSSIKYSCTIYQSRASINTRTIPTAATLLSK